jgi:hypothetical protein
LSGGPFGSVRVLLLASAGFKFAEVDWRVVTHIGFCTTCPDGLPFDRLANSIRHWCRGRLWSPQGIALPSENSVAILAAGVSVKPRALRKVHRKHVKLRAKGDLLTRAQVVGLICLNGHQGSLGTLASVGDTLLSRAA